MWCGQNTKQSSELDKRSGRLYNGMKIPNRLAGLLGGTGKSLEPNKRNKVDCKNVEC